MTTKSLLNTQLISNSFGWTKLSKARLLCEASAVLDWGFDISGTKIVGRVQDGKKSAHRVEVVFSAPDETGKSWLTAKCSCSTARDCVHAAAVALKAAEESGAENSDFSPPKIDCDETNFQENQELQPQYPSYAAFWLKRLDAAMDGAAMIDTAIDGTARVGAAKIGANKPIAVEAVIYSLSLNERLNGELQVEPRIAKRLKTGEFGKSRSHNWQQLAASQAGFVVEQDRVIARLWATCCHSDSLIGPNQALLTPTDGNVLDLLLQRIINTGRAYFDKHAGPLSLGKPLAGEIRWIVHDDSRQAPQIVLTGSSHSEQIQIINSTSPWYLNKQTTEMGPITLPYSYEISKLLMDAPRISANNAAEIFQILSSKSQALPLPQLDIEEELCSRSPVAKLTLSFEKLQYNRIISNGTKEKSIRGLNVAELHFDYGFDSSKLADSWESYRWSNGKRFIVSKRDLHFEQSVKDKLTTLSLKQQPPAKTKPNESTWIAKNDEAEVWLQFVKESVPALESVGWKFEFEESFQYKVIELNQEWLVDISEPHNSPGFWFSLDLGILIDGTRLSLLPIITAAINSTEQNFSISSLDKLNINGKFYAHLLDGRLVALPFERVKDVLSCLAELFDKSNLTGDGRLNISIAQLSSIKNINQTETYNWAPSVSALSLAERIDQFDSAQQLDEPDGLNTTLRTYQKEGLGWLDFISSFNFGGILADDMGLGKTVQILAHIAREKQLGKLKRPCLVICPTSVLPNWMAEIRRLTPALSVVALHGSSRAQLLDIAQCADIVLTTYPLLTRDLDSLSACTWHCLVLDEAQAIKNATTQAAQAVLKLESNYRISLTGTPIENHIGELWSQFNFLMPGLLGTKATFDKVFRAPIEKENNPERLQLLLSRIKPFLLRRTKNQVAKELPPKTEMVKYIELKGKQRDLYETVRLSMHKQVLEEIKAKGIASCGLIILDALMKLRQTCCHTSLVKLAAANEVQESAKLNYLMEMLTDLLEEKRQILIFSQFTSMLDLIATELSERAIEFVQLRGSTKDRATPVERFQRGEVSIFLISLKAGGTGLNLTAADTVIHFDPWWNPAVEDQATDRAYRIGQDKPVFVYRLIAEGTIEERMLDLQNEKRAIANSILADDLIQFNATQKFDEETLSKLFAPLPARHEASD